MAISSMRLMLTTLSSIALLLPNTTQSAVDNRVTLALGCTAIGTVAYGLGAATGNHYGRKSERNNPEIQKRKNDIQAEQDAQKQAQQDAELKRQQEYNTMKREEDERALKAHMEKTKFDDEQQKIKHHAELQQVHMAHSHALQEVRVTFERLLPKNSEETPDMLLQYFQGTFTEQPLAQGTERLRKISDRLTQLEPKLVEESEKTLCHALIAKCSRLTLILGNLNKQHLPNEREEALKSVLEQEKQKHREEMHKAKLGIEQERKNLLQAETEHSVRAMHAVQELKQEVSHNNQVALNNMQEIRNSVHNSLGRVHHDITQSLSRIDLNPVTQQVASLRTEAQERHKEIQQGIVQIPTRVTDTTGFASIATKVNEQGQVLGSLKTELKDATQGLRNEIGQIPTKITQNTDIQTMASNVAELTKKAKNHEAQLGKVEKKVDGIASTLVSTNTKNSAGQTTTSTSTPSSTTA